MKPSKAKPTPEQRKERARKNAAAYRARNPERARLSRLLSQRRKRGNKATTAEDLRLTPAPRPKQEPKAKVKRAPKPKPKPGPVVAAEPAPWRKRFLAWREKKLEGEE